MIERADRVPHIEAVAVTVSPAISAFLRF